MIALSDIIVFLGGAAAGAGGMLFCMIPSAPRGIEQNPAVRTMDTLTHDIYTDRDADRPDAICDRNGSVVLGLCKKCGAAESELEEFCDARIARLCL